MRNWHLRKDRKVVRTNKTQEQLELGGTSAKGLSWHRKDRKRSRRLAERERSRGRRDLRSQWQRSRKETQGFLQNGNMLMPTLME